MLESKIEKKIAIMQPYIFPYIGYFQLINAVDRFVIFDDVNYIKKGWINRNNLLVNNSKNMFTIPLKNASQNRLIKEMEIAEDDKWKDKLIKTIQTSYTNAPYFKEGCELVEGIINSGITNLSEFLYSSIVKVTKYLNIETELVKTSSKYGNGNLKGEDRIIDICKKESANVYINPIGGVNLYSEEKFMEEGITLSFLQTGEVKYTQFEKQFIPNLSIIDLLMFNDRAVFPDFLKNYSLV